MHRATDGSGGGLGGLQWQRVNRAAGVWKHWRRNGNAVFHSERISTLGLAYAAHGLGKRSCEASHGHFTFGGGSLFHWRRSEWLADNSNSCSLVAHWRNWFRCWRMAALAHMAHHSKNCISAYFYFCFSGHHCLEHWREHGVGWCRKNKLDSVFKRRVGRGQGRSENHRAGFHRGVVSELQGA